jgi:protein-S-isoprenylcysteine O-methyltransferase Ste14
MDRRRAAIGSTGFFIAAPGTVAGLVPYWLTGGWSGSGPWPLRVIGGILIAAGLAGVIEAFVRFVREGIGTPAPIAPTKHLVAGGLYRHVRNPMYVAILMIIIGQALWFTSVALVVYAASAWAVTALFVRFYEEPTLKRTYGAQYERYCQNVPAWLPRLRPWSSLD